ncbi:MAG: methionine synthase [Christensenellaceae bacterium]|nr:methionine synthase [Christensenellaceae bacterium]
MKIDIDIYEALSYMGIRGKDIPEDMLDLVKKAKAETEAIIKPRFIYSKFYISAENEKILLLGTDVSFKGLDIYNHLKNCYSCCLIAVTVGNDVDKHINRYMLKDKAFALAIDACSDDAVEQLCDYVEAQIKREYKNITYRYSPGYGDFDLSIQAKFLNLLNAQRRIGLSCTSTNILTPRKSVTAVIGIGE